MISESNDKTIRIWGAGGNGAAVGKLQEVHIRLLLPLPVSTILCMTRMKVQFKRGTHLHVLPSHPARLITQCLPRARPKEWSIILGTVRLSCDPAFTCSPKNSTDAILSISFS